MGKMGKAERIKYLQIIVCAVVGMATGLFVGKQGALTVASTALLVIYTDRGYAGSASYILERIKLQVFMGVTVLGLFSLFRLLPVGPWAAEMLTLVVSLVIGLGLYHKRVLGPLSISVGITVLILLVGVSQSARYPLMRLVNCVIGCAVAAAVTLIPLMIGNRAEAVRRHVEHAARALTADQVDLALASRMHQSGASQLSLLQKDHRWERRRLPRSQLERLLRLHAANGALLTVEPWAGCQGWTEEFDAWFRDLYPAAKRVHHAVLAGESPAALCPRRVQVGSEEEAKAAGALLSYVRAINQCAGADAAGAVPSLQAVQA